MAGIVAVPSTPNQDASTPMPASAISSGFGPDSDLAFVERLLGALVIASARLIQATEEPFLEALCSSDPKTQGRALEHVRWAREAARSAVPDELRRMAVPLERRDSVASA